MTEHIIKTYLPCNFITEHVIKTTVPSNLMTKYSIRPFALQLMSTELSTLTSTVEFKAWLSNYIP